MREKSIGGRSPPPFNSYFAQLLVFLSVEKKIRNLSQEIQTAKDISMHFNYCIKLMSKSIRKN